MSKTLNVAVTFDKYFTIKCTQEQYNVIDKYCMHDVVMTEELKKEFAKVESELLDKAEVKAKLIKRSEIFRILISDDKDETVIDTL